MLQRHNGFPKAITSSITVPLQPSSSPFLAFVAFFIASTASVTEDCCLGAVVVEVAVVAGLGSGSALRRHHLDLVSGQQGALRDHVDADDEDSDCEF